ncbi:MAG: hypothetical protein EPO42_10950 [Gallionellaceae bacterium]|nr:MAG: hypothetical protein EPO42_10950 [Gallionellaceae bacterium]
MSVNKMGSKLAQGVRQVMEQAKVPEAAEKDVARKAAVPVVPAENISKPDTVRVKNKTPARNSSTGYEVLHPERVWPD